MEQFKHAVVRHFEEVLIGLIILAAFIGTYLIEEKSIILNFYYLPVMVASYLLGRRMGLLTAIFSVLAVLLFAAVFPERFFENRQIISGIALLSSWSGFLILASILVGTLYELNEKRMLDLKKAYIGILEILSKYLESTDQYTKGHSLRVSDLAQETARAMGMSPVEVENIRAAGLLHDIGKIEISVDVLRKAADLNAEERALMDTHVSKGGDILSSVGSVLRDVVPIVVAHHKHFITGAGKDPRERSRIPLGARILAVADAFDAMVTDRPYRNGMPPWKAVEELAAKTGTQFDPQVVETFKTVVAGRVEKL